MAVSIMEPLHKKIKLTDEKTGETVEACDADTTVSVLDSSFDSVGSDDETVSNASTAEVGFIAAGKSFISKVDHSGSDSGSDGPGGDSQYEFDEFLRPDNEIVLASGRTCIRSLEDLQYEPTSSQETDKSDSCFHISAEIVSWSIALIKNDYVLLLLPKKTVLFRLSESYHQYKLADPFDNRYKIKDILTIQEDKEGKELTGMYTMMGPQLIMPFTFKFTLCTRRQADLSLGEDLHLHLCTIVRKPQWLLPID